MSSSVVKICSAGGAARVSQLGFVRCFNNRTDAVYLYAVAGGYHVKGSVNGFENLLGKCLALNRTVCSSAPAGWPSCSNR